MMTHRLDWQRVNLVDAENVNLTHEDLNTTIDKYENWWNICLLPYDTLTSRVKSTSNVQMLHCWWRFRIFDESYRYKNKYKVGWQIVIKARIGFKVQVTALKSFHSLHAWSYQWMRLFSGSLNDLEDDCVMERDVAETLYSAVKYLMQAIWTEDEEDQQGVTHCIIRNVKRWMIWGWPELKIVHQKLLAQIPKKIAHCIDFLLTEKEQAMLKTPVERDTLQGHSGVWRFLDGTCYGCW